jgi:sporulation protein YlmC with PRC-barrel domain
MESDTAARTGTPLEAEETNRLISSEKVDGTAVYNRKGDHLGTVHHVMIDKSTGQVAYAVMSFGGFLGIGEDYHPIPWRALKYDVEMDGYVVDTDRSRLEGAPRYAGSNQPNWSDRADIGRIDGYWQVDRV